MMMCPAVRTGQEFLVAALAHLDCQAQTLGSFGFQSLASPGSLAATVLTALLTLFIAIYAIRLLFGPGDEPGSLINAVLRIGIVLTIATSWPAWRSIAYDLVFYGPPDVAAAIMPATMPEPRTSLPQRLQGIDQGMATLTDAGTGRETGALLEPGGFNTIALPDETGFGWARSIYLATTIGTLGFLRIASGLLLALAPLMAGLLLFDFSRGLFVGWLRGLVFIALGSLGTTVVLAVQLAVMEPWIADALNKRGLGYATPTAPTELLAFSLAFAVALVGLLLLLARVAFMHTWLSRVPMLHRMHQQAMPRNFPRSRQTDDRLPVQSRAAAISDSVASLVRRERQTTEARDYTRRTEVFDRASTPGAESGSRGPVTEPLGSGHRRSLRRETSSQRSRDHRE